MNHLFGCVLVFAVGLQYRGMVLSDEFICPGIDLPNGMASQRSKGRFINFSCEKDFELVGVTFAVCTESGIWNQPTPTCVGTTCEKPARVPNLMVEELNNGGVLRFQCGAGLTRSGPEKLTCDGTKWNDKPPTCVAGTRLVCDFENGELCGWSQDVDDDFDWTWHRGETPTAQTGPQKDHTTNTKEGHYLFMESSAPQSNGQKTRLLSPVYAPEKMVNMCVEFFYHMFGPDGAGEVGDLGVLVRMLSVSTQALGPSSLIFNQSGNHGDMWHRGYVELPKATENFQIVFQATRRKSWSGDIAIDDIKFDSCVEEPTASVPTRDNLVDPRGDQGNKDMTTTPTTSTTQTTTTTTTTTPTTTTKTPTTMPTTTATTTTITTPTTTPTTTAPETTSTETATLTTTTQETTESPSTQISTTETHSTTVEATTFSIKPQTEQTAVVSTCHDVRYPNLSSYSSTSTTDVRNGIYNQEVDNTTIDNNDNDNSNKNDHDNNDDEDNNDDDDNDHENDTDENHEDERSTESPDNIDNVSNGSSTFKHPSHNERSKLPNTDYSDVKADKTATSHQNKEISHGAIQDKSNPSASKTDLLPLIIGVAAAVLVAVVVIGVLAYMWTRNQRRKTEKEQEDQMNIITEYVETNLSV